MYKTIKTSLASFGMSSRIFHGPLLKAHKGFDIINIVERNKNESKSVYPDAKIIRSFGELCSDNETELIIVNTPDSLHYEHTKMALEAGKHVIVEKPFTQKYEHALELTGIAKKNNLLLSVFQNRRWDGDFLTVKRIIEQGLLGRLVDYESHFDRFRNTIRSDSWKEQRESGTGTLYNLGSHLIDQALTLFGNPQAVHADIRYNRKNTAVDDYFDVLLRYTDVSVRLKASYLVRKSGPRFILHGTEGSFLKWGIDPQEQSLDEGNLPLDETWGKDSSDYYGKLDTCQNSLHYCGSIETLNGNYPAFYDNVYDCIRGNGQLQVRPEEAANVIKIIELALKSHQLRKEIIF